MIAIPRCSVCWEMTEEVAGMFVFLDRLRGRKTFDVVSFGGYG